MMECVISIRDPDDWVTLICRRFDASVRIAGCIPAGSSGVRQIVTISSKEGDAPRVVDLLNGLEGVDAGDLAIIGGSRVIGSVTTARSPAYSSLLESGCFFESGWTGERMGHVHWHLVFTRNEMLQSLVNDLRSHGLGVELHRLSHIEHQESLTPRQEHILHIALESGFFDHTKKIGLRDLAKRFGISASTLSEILRKGLRKVIGAYLNEGERA